VDFDNEFLEAFLPQTRTRLLRAFASAIQSARFSGPTQTQLASGTVSDTVNHVAASFVDAGFNDPGRTEVGGPSLRFLQRQYKCYKNLNANIKQQKVITASIILKLISHANLPFATPAEKVASELAVGAFFFAMRLCESTDVSGPRRTKPLRLGHIRFFGNNKALDLLGPTLLSATAISITFEFQKTNICHETVHQHATILPNLCSVKAWAKVVRRVLSYPGCDTKSLVSTVLTNDKRRLVTSNFLATQLQAAAKRIGPDVLGLSHLDVGTHSIRSGGAMAMYVAGVPVFTIMLIGCWSSPSYAVTPHLLPLAPTYWPKEKTLHPRPCV
jgi:hypothetical protein